MNHQSYDASIQSCVSSRYKNTIEKTEQNMSLDTKRDSIKFGNHTSIVKQITTSKPKAVFLDGKPTLDRSQFKLGKSNQIGVKEQGLQSIRRAAFATETNDDVRRTTYLFDIHFGKIRNLRVINI